MAKTAIDSTLSYWIEALECALDECGAWGVLNSEQMQQVARSLVMSAEMQGQAFGHECIPNPLQAEIDSLKKRHASELALSESREERFRGELARRIGVEPRRVVIHNERIEVLRQ